MQSDGDLNESVFIRWLLSKSALRKRLKLKIPFLQPVDNENGMEGDGDLSGQDNVAPTPNQTPPKEAKVADEK